MNENDTIKAVQKLSKGFMNKYVMLLTLLWLSLATMAQGTAGKIAGTVISAKDNQTMIGVSVRVNGTSIGAVTDIDGNFSVTAKTDDVLTISYMGYISQQVKVTTSGIKVKMEEDQRSLDEVIVIGYGTIKKKLNTGATVQVKGDDLLKQNTTNALQSLQGATPGVQITSNSGQPGKGMTVTIRGLGSINGSGPLYIVDGVQTGDISYLNNADIASIDVLKDAASAAIYGAQASNGVVLVTTRTGTKGKSQVTFDSFYGVQNVANTIESLNADQYALIMNEAAVNSGNTPLYPTGGKPTFLSKFGDTNWIASIKRDNAPTYNHSMSVNGGTEASIYSLSLGLTGQDGVFGNSKNSSYQRYNFKMNTEHNLYKNFLKVGQHLTFTYTKNSGINEGGNYSGSPIRAALQASPFLPMYDDNGNYLNNTAGKSVYKGTVWNPWSPGEYNPYADMNMQEAKSASQKTLGDIYAEINPIKGLKLKTTFGLEYNSGTNRTFMPSYQLSMLKYNNDDYVIQGMNKDVSWNWDNTITYDFNFGKSAFTALAGSSIREYQGEWMSSRNANLVIADFDHAWISNTTNTATSTLWSYTGGPSDEAMTQSAFGRLNYNFDEKYMVNATFRADGSSRFAKNNRWGYFPSVSAGWVLTNENFLNENKVVDFLKLRASWGQVGNQNVGAWNYLAKVVTSDTYYYFGNGTNSNNLSAIGASVNVPGSYPTLGNPLLKWETSEQTDLGFDARFFRSKLSVDFDIYNKTSKGWLIDAPTRPESGGSTVLINGGDVSNSGVEVKVSWNDKIGNDFNYYVSANASYNKNKVGNVPTADGIVHGNSNEAYNNAAAAYRKAQTGMPIGYFWGYKTNGILQNTSEVNAYVASMKNGSASNTLQGRNITKGDVRYVDVNGDGVIDENDKTMIGNPNPDYTFGLSLGFSWKALDFSLTSNGVAGNEIFQSYRDYGNQYANYTTAILGRWHGEGTSNLLPRVTETNINYQISDIFIHKGDFLRISNIQLGYDFAKNIKWKNLSQLRLYAAVQNAFTFTSYDGMDPEVGYGTDASTSGVDLGFYPRPRTFIVGVNVKF